MLEVIDVNTCPSVGLTQFFRVSIPMSKCQVSNIGTSDETAVHYMKPQVHCALHLEFERGTISFTQADIKPNNNRGGT